MDASENQTSNPTAADKSRRLLSLIDRRLSRRGFVGGISAAYGAFMVGCKETPTPRAATPIATDAKTSDESAAFSFEEISRGLDETHHVANNHDVDVIIRWGDPLFDDSPDFDPYNQSAAAQRRQFGYNNDYIGFVPLSDNRGLLCVNHEYTSTLLMLPNVAKGYPGSITREHCLIELAAHGGSIVEIQRDNGRWNHVVGSKYNRRITGDTTPMEITGPAAGHPRLQTGEDPDGRRVAGTLNNCAGGMTPWGTYLMAEENFNFYFMGQLADDHPEAENHKRYGVPRGFYQWGRYIDRYDISKEPNEPNRYGWIVEVDPRNPKSQPKKRTALGRFKHEGAESIIAPDGRLVVYMGDDQVFDYLYKFVSTNPVDLDNTSANAELLDDGTLYVAKFFDTGSVEWMPLTHGEGPLSVENGFLSQADVMIEARRAADLLGATPMDRPEDVEPDAKSGRVWVMLTNNSARKDNDINAANPRANNANGHIIEITEPDGDFASTRSQWDILVKCGDPNSPDIGATWNPLTSENGWWGSPDNCAVDPLGRLWISTDGNEKTGSADGVWTIETDGAARGTGRAFFRAPIGAEVCGPRFTPDGKSLFLAIQHPGDERGRPFETPLTRWPDFKDDMPPRPSVLAIRHSKGKPVGSA